MSVYCSPAELRCAEINTTLFLRRSVLCLSVLVWSHSAPAQGKLVAAGAESPTNLLSNPGFEVLKPALWEPTGAGAKWTNTTSRTPDWSLSLSGPSAARWEQKEAVQGWISGFPQVRNPKAEVGAWVKMEGVNTHPSSEEEKFQLVFEFFEDADQKRHVLGGPIVLDLPQEGASTTGWVEIVSDPISFPGERAAKSARVTFRKGGSTDGIAFLDDLFIRNVQPSAVGWLGHFFNPNMDVGDQWYYWWSYFFLGSADWPKYQDHFVTVSNEDAHSGKYSLRVEANDSNQTEAVVVSERVPVDPGRPLLVSFWLKHSGNLSSESIGADLNNLGLTALWYSNLAGGTAGFGLVGGIDILLDGNPDDRLIPLADQEGEWMHYAFVLNPKPGDVGVEIRIRYYHDFTGTTYWDDFFVAPVSDVIEALPR